jgi:hypothetical protein
MDVEEGSIGIGAMIVFIALILVAALSSTIIINSVEELSQDAEHTLSERYNSKIVAQSAYIFLYEPCWQETYTDVSQCNSMNPERGHHELEMHFKLKGDVDIPASSIAYHISCTETLSSVPMRKSGFDGSRTWISVTSNSGGWAVAPFNLGAVVLPGQSKDTGAEAIDTLEPGITYAVMIDLYDNKNTAGINDDEGCSIPVDYRVNLMITIEGGMESYYIVKCDNYRLGLDCL